MLDKDVSKARREYLRAWRKQNPEKVKQYNREYWERRVRREVEKNAETSRKE